MWTLAICIQFTSEDKLGTQKRWTIGGSELNDNGLSSRAIETCVTDVNTLLKWMGHRRSVLWLCQCDCGRNTSLKMVLSDIVRKDNTSDTPGVCRKRGTRSARIQYKGKIYVLGYYNRLEHTDHRILKILFKRMEIEV